MTVSDEAVEAALARLPMEALSVITRDEIARALSAASTHLAADAWDEGSQAGYINHANEQWSGASPMNNPYRSGT